MPTFYDRRPGFEKIPDSYRCMASARVDDGEEFRCYGCGFVSEKIGTPHYAWLKNADSPPAPLIITLCDVCQGQLGGARI